MKLFSNLIAATFLAGVAMTNIAPVSAQEQAIVLEGEVKVEKTVTDATGATSVELVEPDKIVPGDKLLFSTVYTNSSAEAVENFVVTNPIPSAVTLAPDADAQLTVSTDGGATWGKLAELTVEAEDGTRRAAQHADVTHIRWTLASVSPGESGRLEYPAIIR